MDALAGMDLSKIPAVAPPPGVVPNFVNPPSQAYIPKIVIYVTLPLMVIFLGMRLYTRLKKTKLGVDDALCVLAAASICASIGFTFRVLEQAAGPHMWDIPLSKITPRYAQDATGIALSYYFAAMFIKAAILTFYLRIFTPSHAANVLLWVGIVFSTVFHIVIIAVYLGTCLPRPNEYATGGWLSLEYSERTYSIVGYLSSSSATIGTAIDFYILLVPLIFLWKLQMSTHRKLGLTAVFASGGIACAFSIVCTVYRWRISSVSPQEQDLSWKGPPIYAYSIAEINVGIMCSCMPIVFTLFKGFAAWSGTIFSRLRSLTSRNRSTKQPESSENSNIHMPPYKAPYKDISDEGLPHSLPPVENGKMKGVRYFMRNFDRTTPATSQADATQLLTMRSMDYNYHAQMHQQEK